VEEHFQLPEGTALPHFEGVNAGPGQPVAVLSSDDPSQLTLMNFGFESQWPGSPKRLLFNTRSEGDHNPDDDPRYRGALGIFSKAVFRSAIRSRRCLVPADAFIEGPKIERLNRPYCLFPSSPTGVFAMAALWQEYSPSPGTQIPRRGFALLTTSARGVVAEIGHHRAPVVLNPAHYRDWLNPASSVQDLSEILYAGDSREWNAYPIDPRIKNPALHSAELMRAIGPSLYPLEQTRIDESWIVKGFGFNKSLKPAGHGVQSSLFD
jgi:putative SOS response-associated peptidase YedK